MENMKKYFYTDGSNQFGPFTLDELMQEGITRETSIWFNELGEWKKAGNVQELNELFALTPPPVQQPINFNQHYIRQSSDSSTMDVLVFVAVVFWFAARLLNILISKTVDDWSNNDLVTFYQIASNTIFNLLPVVFALSVKNKTLRAIAVSFGVLLFLDGLHSNIKWLIEVLR